MNNYKVIVMQLKLIYNLKTSCSPWVKLYMHIKLIIILTDILALPGLQARQQRAAFVPAQGPGSGPTGLPAQPLPVGHGHGRGV